MPFSEPEEVHRRLAARGSQAWPPRCSQDGAALGLVVRRHNNDLQIFVTVKLEPVTLLGVLEIFPDCKLQIKKID